MVQPGKAIARGWADQIAGSLAARIGDWADLGRPMDSYGRAELRDIGLAFLDLALSSHARLVDVAAAFAPRHSGGAGFRRDRGAGRAR